MTNKNQMANKNKMADKNKTKATKFSLTMFISTLKLFTVSVSKIAKSLQIRRFRDCSNYGNCRGVGSTFKLEGPLTSRAFAWSKGHLTLTHMFRYGIC